MARGTLSRSSSSSGCASSPLCSECSADTSASRFFDAYDNDRAALGAAYAPICTFSFHADTAHPARARAKKIGHKGDKRFPNQHKLDWKQYLTADGSRNLSRVKNAGACASGCWESSAFVGDTETKLTGVAVTQKSASRRSR